MKIDLKVNEPSLYVGDLELGEVFQIKETRADFYMIVELFNSQIKEVDRSDMGCIALSLKQNRVVKLSPKAQVVVLHDVVITNKG